MKKALKIIMYVILAIIVITLVAAIFLPKEYSLERNVTINRPLQEVFSYIVSLKNQDNFSVWMTRDPEVTIRYSGNDGTVGFISAWESEDQSVGTGEQEIIAIDQGRRIDYELRLAEPFESICQAYMLTHEVSQEQTQVTWGFIGRLNYPMNLMLLFMDMEAILGNDMEAGLQNLKVILESHDDQS